MSSIFGSKSKVTNVAAPTGFQSLPDFAQTGFEDLFTRGQELSQQTSPFAPVPLGQSFTGARQAFKGISPISGEQIQEGIGQFTNPFTQQVIDPAVEDIRRQTRGLASDIGVGATRAGAFGGTRDALARAQLGESAQREIGRVSGQLRSQGFGDAASKALQNLQFGQQAQLQAGQGLAGLVPTERAAASQQQEVPLKQLQALQSVLTAVPVGGGSASQNTKVPSFGSQLGGAAASAGISALMGSLFSDKRLKDNIEIIDNIDGINLYEFNYKGVNRRFRGVMAQEIEKIIPKAVFEVFGIKKVIYSMLNPKLQMVEV